MLAARFGHPFPSPTYAHGSYFGKSGAFASAAKKAVLMPDELCPVSPRAAWNKTCAGAFGALGIFFFYISVDNWEQSGNTM
jgi:hypothetical protein